MKWGNVHITKKEDGENPHLYGRVDEADQDFKGTKKFTWLTNDPAHQLEIKLVELDHLIIKEKIEESDDIEKIVNNDSRVEYNAICEQAFGSLPAKSLFQFERLGYYYVDNVGVDGVLAVCNFVPNGKTKGMTKDSQKLSAAEASKGKGGDGAKNKAKQEGVGPDGKISKAALKKMQKKEAKKAAKTGGAAAAGESKKPAGGDKKDKPAPNAAAGNAPKPQGIPTMELKAGFFSGPIADLWEEILENQQWLGGAKLTQADAEASRIIKGQFPNPDLHPNLFAWCAIATKFTDIIMKGWPAGECPLPAGQEKKEEPKPAPAKKNDDDIDEDDLFGDGGDDAEPAPKLVAKPKNKKVVVAKSIILLEVKGFEADQDLDALAKKIFAIEKDGLLWKTEYKLEPVAFGVKKLVIGMTVEDEKVSVDDIIELLESWEDDVQSVDILAFNKV